MAEQGMFEPQNWAWPINIVGLGAIGSQVFFDLYKLGFSEIHIWDKDLLEERNLKRQKVYRRVDVGKPKSEAAKLFARRQGCESKIHVHKAYVQEDTGLSGVVISGVDSMAGRQVIWEAVKRNFHRIPLFIDCRIGGDFVQVLSFTPADVQFWVNYELRKLFGDDHKAELPCWESELSAPAAFAAAVVVANLTRFARNKPVKNNVSAHLGELTFTVN